MFIYIRRHYKTINITEIAKSRLNNLSQNKYNYQSQKAEFNKLIIKANKTKKQKVDLLKKDISSRVKDLALTLSYKISNTNYKS